MNGIKKSLFKFIDTKKKQNGFTKIKRVYWVFTSLNVIPVFAALIVIYPVNKHTKIINDNC